MYPSALIPRVRYPNRFNDESQTLSICGFEFGSSPLMIDKAVQLSKVCQTSDIAALYDLCPVAIANL